MNAALDIGYSNLKLAAMTGNGSMSTQVLPAGAASVDCLPEQLGDADDDGLIVLVGDDLYAAGVPQSKFTKWNRSLHEDYPGTNDYRALFHAGLLSLGTPEVNTLVTGLPVDQYRDETRRKALANQLTGIHQVTRKRQIQVNTVQVVPQPLGAYLDMVYTLDDPTALADSRVLVIDPGFFSVDWVVIEQGALHHSLSGTSQMATSMILESVQTQIRDEHGGKVSLAKLEQAVRTSKDQVMLLGEYVKLAPYLEAAANAIVPVSMDALRQSMRTGADDIDIVLIAGGGAHLYEKQVRELFPKSRLIVPDTPVLANVRGFGRLAERRTS